MSANRVRVVVVAWNAGPWLERCLAALDAQTHRDFEVVVVDNASDDDAVPRARLRFPAARFVDARANLGFAAGANLGAAQPDDGARAEWIATLNPDALPDPDWLAELLAAACRYPDAAMFGSTQLSETDPSRLDGAGDAYFAAGLPWRGGYGRSAADAPSEGATFSPCAAAALYRRAAFDAAGGFAESFFCYCEDIDLAFRLRLRGGHAIQVRRAQVRHAGSASAGAGSDFQRYHGTRNLIWTFVRCMPGPLFWPLLPAHMALAAALLAWAVSRGHAAPVARGMRDALAGLGRVWGERRAIQAGRTIGWRALARAFVWAPWRVLARDFDVRSVRAGEG